MQLPKVIPGLSYDSEAGSNHLPLERIAIHADIIDRRPPIFIFVNFALMIAYPIVSAVVTLTQCFWSYSFQVDTPDVKYSFPVPARAAVCGFRMTTANEVVVKAVAKDKEEAKEITTDASIRGDVYGLLENVCDGGEWPHLGSTAFVGSERGVVFCIYLGSLPQDKLITCELTVSTTTTAILGFNANTNAQYVMDLLGTGIANQVQLRIPASFGTSNRLDTHPSRPTPNPRVSISTNVYMSGLVRRISSPTHLNLEVRRNGERESTHGGAKYISPDFLADDFILNVVADGLDRPRCIAQRDENGAVAMQLAVVPKFDARPFYPQEYIFVVDRSTSMSHYRRIEIAKSSLAMLFHALPTRGTYFNIFDFGQDCNSLWSSSQEYNDLSLSTAVSSFTRVQFPFVNSIFPQTEYVEVLVSNQDNPGSNLAQALTQAFLSRKTGMPTACFVLSDDEVRLLPHLIHSKLNTP